MADNLKNFLVELAEDQQKLLAFKDNPDEVLNSSNLNSAEKAIVKSGDKNLIASAISDTDARATVVAVTICLVIT